MNTSSRVFRSASRTRRNQGRQSGIALVTVLLTTTIALLLAVTFSLIAMSESRSTRASVNTEKAVQLADAGSERARRLIITSFNSTFLSISNYLLAVADDAVPELQGVKTVNVDGTDVHWEVVGVSDPQSAYGWIDVAATADLSGGAVQTVVRRVGFGASSAFNLAMLSETTDCMFCHLRVNGDVGNLVFMRPGWGSEGGGGQGSGGSLSGLGESVVRGNVYAAQEVTNDRTDGNRLNGARITGEIERNSKNSSLPRDLDGDGIPDFPPINREVAILNALGSIGGGTSSCVVPIGGTYTGSCSTANYNGTIDGNLILEGTKTNPIVIDGDIWVEGDVIIKGYVQGLGGLYSGRNVYLAGDVQAVNAAYRIDGDRCVNEAGNVILTANDIAATGFSPADACARQSIADDTDALRIAARGSIIIGDYTEYDEEDALLPVAQRQSSKFYKEQFGFEGSGRNRYYDRATGDELRCSGSTCLNADNQVITNRIQLDGYDASFRPGRVSGSGFESWLSDAQYQEILGTETFDYNSWRWVFQHGDYTVGRRIATMLDDIVRSGFPLAEALAIIDHKVDFTALDNFQFNRFLSDSHELGHDLPSSNRSYYENVQGNDRGVTVDDTGQEARYQWSGNSLRVVHTAEREYETQVNRIDAFLYSNQRIGGKTSMQAMSITGGLVTRDLGILAPGRALENGPHTKRFADKVNDHRDTACSDPNSRFYVYGSEDCALTVNYDHRLRNGGYGYNIIEGQIGITLDWRLADRKDERVTP